ncbi:MAG: tripartite tricarboxylate transporter substrate binding protein, partial [Alphaproteobacteria bacterium]|nr:tripartite tricarboxylate transporter substrate binding protein [Alphaproteobacteria bacterium]
PATAQYPEKLVRIVVPYVAGGNLDLIGRIAAQALTEALGQTFIVDNKAGANGNVGTDQVARSAPDGYTLAMVSAGTLTINQSLYPKMPFDSEKDLTPITLVASGPMVLEVHPSLPIKSVADLVAYAKSKPGALNFGSGGNGTLAHLSLEMLKTRAGIDIVHVPYKGTSLALNDLAGASIQGMFDTLSTSVPFIESGKLRALAVTSAKRSAILPDLPTIGESGVAGYVAEAWSGLVAPAGTPPAIVAKIQSALAVALVRPETKEKLARLGSEPVVSTSAEFAETIRADKAKWAEIIKASGAKID